jgi:hypothetical protein
MLFTQLITGFVSRHATTPGTIVIANAAFEAVLGEAVEVVLISLVRLQKGLLNAQHEHVPDGFQGTLNVGIELPTWTCSC